MPDDGVLIHLGDICIGNDDRWEFALLTRLPTNFKRYWCAAITITRATPGIISRGWGFVCADALQHLFRQADFVFACALEKAGRMTSTFTDTSQTASIVWTRRRGGGTTRAITGSWLWKRRLPPGLLETFLKL